MENWKTIEGFEAYEVSNLGRVRRALPGRCTYVGKVLKQRINNNRGGHPIVQLWSNGKTHREQVHRLVARAFIPNPKGLPEVNHLGDNTDSRACMLEWRSKLGNVLHSVQNERGGDGVSFEPRRQHWVAYLNTNHHGVYGHRYLGSFPTKEQALAARRAAVAALPDVT
jgi:hypothetical protein